MLAESDVARQAAGLITTGAPLCRPRLVRQWLARYARMFGAVRADFRRLFRHVTNRRVINIIIFPAERGKEGGGRAQPKLVNTPQPLFPIPMPVYTSAVRCTFLLVSCVFLSHFLSHFFLFKGC